MTGNRSTGNKSIAFIKKTQSIIAIPKPSLNRPSISPVWLQI